MKTKEKFEHNFSLPIIALMLLVAMSGILVIICGATIHNKITDNTQMHYTLYTGVEYISEKCRQTDKLELDNTYDTPCLKLSFDDTVTYIYVYNDYLREYTAFKDTELLHSAGQKLLKIKNMQINENKGVFTITLTDYNDYQIQTCISILGGINEKQQ